MIAVGAAILLDTAFGIYRSVKIRGWHFVTSRRLSEVINGKIKSIEPII